MHPRAEEEIQGAIAVEVDQGDDRHDPFLHRGEIDLLQREAATEIRIELDAEVRSDHDVDPAFYRTRDEFV